VLAGIVLAAMLAAGTFVADDEPTPVPTPTPADCSIVGVGDAEYILGYDVEGPDQISREGGICYFSSSDFSHEGRVSYAIVTPQDLPRRRAFYYAFSRRCAPAAKGTFNELACRQFLKLAAAQTIDDYYAARTGSGDASPVPGLGASAVVSGNALYLRRGQKVFEISVTRDGEFDLARSRQLATLLLTRIPR